MVLPIVLLSVSFLAVSWFTYEKIKKYSLKAVLIKTCCSLLFIALAIYSAYHSHYHIFAPLAISALILGMLGDISLEMKYVFRDHDKEFTYAGFVAFGLGHVCYVTGLFLEFYHEQNVLYAILPFVGALFMAVLCLLIEKLLKLKYGTYKPIIFAYALTLFSTVFVSLSFAIMYKFEVNSLTLIFIGGCLFAISDLVLNGTYFGEGHEKPMDLAINTYLYYIAQNLIAFSLFFLI